MSHSISLAGTPKIPYNMWYLVIHIVTIAHFGHVTCHLTHSYTNLGLNQGSFFIHNLSLHRRRTPVMGVSKLSEHRKNLFRDSSTPRVSNIRMQSPTWNFKLSLRRFWTPRVTNNENEAVNTESYTQWKRRVPRPGHRTLSNHSFIEFSGPRKFERFTSFAPKVHCRQYCRRESFTDSEVSHTSPLLLIWASLTQQLQFPSPAHSLNSYNHNVQKTFYSWGTWSRSFPDHASSE